ncbi:MAG TPA: zinc transporter ZupT [Bacteroidales bacterium]|nr:zinc transporter ZupT [Bacteroidales bacterium]
MDWNNVILAFVLTLFAGLATAIGGALAFFTRRTNTTFLSYSLGFSAGVMIYISFTEILADANHIISQSVNETSSSWRTFIFFIAGFFLTALIDKIIPSRKNPHEVKSIEQMDIDCPKRSRRLLRIGLFSAIALAIHNFPEGIATFMASVSDITVGVSIALAIAIHNIPEGIAVSVPVYYATGSRRKAFVWAALSGLSEPVGAVAGYFILSLFKQPVVLGYVFAIVAGIMIYISFDELLPAAHKYGKHHIAIYGLISGIIVIGISLILL